MPGPGKIINMLTHTITHFTLVHILQLDNSVQSSSINVAEQSDKYIGSSKSITALIEYLQTILQKSSALLANITLTKEFFQLI